MVSGRSTARKGQRGGAADKTYRDLVALLQDPEAPEAAETLRHLRIATVELDAKLRSLIDPLLVEGADNRVMSDLLGACVASAQGHVFAILLAIATGDEASGAVKPRVLQ